MVGLVALALALSVVVRAYHAAAWFANGAPWTDGYTERWLIQTSALSVSDIALLWVCLEQLRATSGTIDQRGVHAWLRGARRFWDISAVTFVLVSTVVSII